MNDVTVAPEPTTTELTATPSVTTTPPATELGGAPAAAEPKPGDTPAPKAAEPVKPGDAPVALDVAKLTMPEGFKVDEGTMKEFGELMSNDKLNPQERAQALIDLQAKALKAVGDSHTAAWNTVNEKWVKEVKADPEIGGAKFDTTKATIAKAIDSLGPARATEFRQALDMTGAGNNPAIWRGLAAFAKLLTEGNHVSGNPAAEAKRDIGQEFFPNSPSMHAAKG